MNDMTLTIKVEAPDLVAAILRLAGAVNPSQEARPPMAIPATPPAPTIAPAPPVADPVTPPVPTAPVVVPTAPPAPTVPVTPPAPAAPAAPAVPVAGTPTYTLDQIAKAGASLVDAGKMEPLLALLSRYGVQAVTQLAPEHYGAFATELRALGAQI